MPLARRIRAPESRYKMNICIIYCTNTDRERWRVTFRKLYIGFNILIYHRVTCREKTRTYLSFSNWKLTQSVRNRYVLHNDISYDDARLCLQRNILNEIIVRLMHLIKAAWELPGNFGNWRDNWKFLFCKRLYIFGGREGIVIHSV